MQELAMGSNATSSLLIMLSQSSARSTRDLGCQPHWSDASSCLIGEIQAASVIGGVYFLLVISREFFVRVAAT
jgi:hypothetical protein